MAALPLSSTPTSPWRASCRCSIWWVRTIWRSAPSPCPAPGWCTVTRVSPRSWVCSTWSRRRRSRLHADRRSRWKGSMPSRRVGGRPPTPPTAWNCRHHDLLQGWTRPSYSQGQSRSPPSPYWYTPTVRRRTSPLPSGSTPRSSRTSRWPSSWAGRSTSPATRSATATRNGTSGSTRPPPVRC